MSFLNPYFLFALFAVAIPIFLHLFNLHKVKKVEFSTLMFLKEIQKSKLRRIRIKQLLLLILRIIIIVLLVFAFANPVYKGYLSGKNPDIRKCGIFVLDNSFSMAVKDENGSYFEQAKKSLENVLKLYNSEDKLFLITPSRMSEFNKSEIKDASSLIDSAKKLDFSYVPLRLHGIMNYIVEVIGREKYPLYEIFLFSDFQKSNFPLENEVKNRASELSNNIYFYNIDIGKRQANNISIEKAEIKSKIIENNKDVKISVVLKNFNKFNTLNKQVNLFIDDKKIDEAVTDIASLERKEITFNFKPTHSGSTKGYAELLQSDFFEDEIIQDNKFYFSFDVPEKINIGLIGESENNIKYIKLALESAEKLNNPEGSQKFYVIDQSTTAIGQVLKSDMMIISGKNSFSGEEINNISDYIKNGGGVLLFPGKTINMENYNSLFSRLNAFRIEGLGKVIQDSGLYKKFEKIDFEHPLFSGAFKNKNLNISSEKFYVESPTVNLIYNILTGNNSSGLMYLPGSKVFLSESGYYEGKLIFCTVSADDEMSDFPKKSLFPLIINKSIFYLGIGEYKNDRYIVGNNNIINFGKDKILAVKYKDYENPGSYQVSFPPDFKRNFFSLNRDTIESDLQKADMNDVKEFFNKYKIKNVEYISMPADINSIVTKSREGKELWKYLIALALVFIIMEMLYSKKLEKI